MFAALTGIVERPRTMGQVRRIRLVLWAVLGSAALPLLTTMPNQVILNTCPPGALSSLASAALARRSARRRQLTA